MGLTSKSTGSSKNSQVHIGGGAEPPVRSEEPGDSGPWCHPGDRTYKKLQTILAMVSTFICLMTSGLLTRVTGVTALE